MKRVMLALVLVTACGADEAGNRQDAAKPTVDTSRLAGLYEGKAGVQVNQICMVGKESDRASFGIVTWGDNLSSCSGSGSAVRQGTSLRLEMKGDQPCAIEARIEGGRISLPDKVPQSCAYYCGGGAQLAGVLDKKGDGEKEALKALDLVGEPLCAGVPAP